MLPLVVPIPAQADPQFTRHVDDVFRTMEELFEAGEAVRQLLMHPGWAHVARLVEAETATVDAELDGRLLDSRSAYARLHGRRGGLRAMEEAARAIVGKADRKLEQQRSRHEGAAEPVPVGG